MSLEGLSQEEVHALATAAQALRDNPKTRLGFLRLSKVANPELTIPEVDQLDATMALAKQNNDRFADLESKLAQSEAEKAANALYDELREERVVTSKANFSELVQYAAKSGFQTTKDGLVRAAAFRAEEQRSAEPTPTFLSPATPVELNKDLIKNPTQWARTQAAAALNELRANRR